MLKMAPAMKITKKNDKRANRFGRGAFCLVAFVLGLPFGAVFLLVMSRADHETHACLSCAGFPDSAARFENVLSWQPSAMSNYDMARANLMCAIGLPGSEDMDIAKCLRTLDSWTRQVEKETRRNEYRFRQKPEAYGNSEAEYRMGMLVTVLKQDFGVCYNPELALTSANFSDKSFEMDSRNLFLHGLLRDKRRGTCASIPVLIAAISRRLGYPVRLVPAKGHLFVRWHDGKERLNVDAACSGGYNTHPDEYYRKWPMAFSDEEARVFGYLRSLSPDEELAAFLAMRAQCFYANTTNLQQASLAVARAHSLAPSDPEHLVLLRDITLVDCQERWKGVIDNMHFK